MHSMLILYRERKLNVQFYTRVSSGDNESDSCGGGGGSYNAGKNQQNECCYNTAGHGQVTITLI